MHLSEEQKTEINKEIVRNKIRHILAHKDEINDMGQAAQMMWHSLLQSPTWSIVEGPRPKEDAEGNKWVEPEEVWSETPVVTGPSGVRK